MVLYEDMKPTWASEVFFQGGGHQGIFPKFFQMGAKSGEI